MVITFVAHAQYELHIPCIYLSQILIMMLAMPIIHLVHAAYFLKTGSFSTLMLAMPIIHLVHAAYFLKTGSFSTLMLAMPIIHLVHAAYFLKTGSFSTLMMCLSASVNPKGTMSLVSQLVMY